MITKALKHPITGFIAIILGVYMGIFYPQQAKAMKDLGSAYLLLIQMTIVPILVSAIISSVGLFIQNPNFPLIASKSWKVVLVTMFAVVFLGLILSVVLRPGKLSKEGADYLSGYIGSQTDLLVLNLDEKHQGTTEKQSFLSVFIRTLIPQNIFSALVEGKTLSLAFVAIVMGIAAGFGLLRAKDQTTAHAIIALCDNTFMIFQTIIGAILTALPIALVFIIANLIAENGLGIFGATARLIGTFYALGVFLLLLGSVFIAIITRTNFFYVLRVSLAPAFLGFMTKSSVATIPYCIENLQKGMNIDEHLAKLLVPLFMGLCRYGNLAYFAVVVIFSTEIYQIHFGIIEFIVVVLSLLFASIATAGATGFATLNVISIAFLPLGVPVETMLVILYAIDPIIDPIRTMLIVHTNFTAISIIGNDSLPTVAAMDEESTDDQIDLDLELQ